MIYPSHFTYFTWGGMASDGGVDKGHNGILVQGTDNAIRGCTIKYSAGSGIVIKGARNLITRCQISDIDYSGTYSCPISVAAPPGMVTGKNRIWFNTIRRTGRDCIQLYGASAEDIRYNDISDSGLICKDLGLVYVWGRDGKGTRIAYNWVHDNRSHGPGISLDNYCQNFVVHHNVIWNCGDGIRVNGPAEGHRLYNNTLFNCRDVGTRPYNQWPNHTPGYWTAGGYGNIYRYTKINNLFLSTRPAAQLEDFAKENFSLETSAPAIDSGKPVAGITDDFSWESPDQGHMNLVERCGSRACVDEPNKARQRTRANRPAELHRSMLKKRYMQKPNIIFILADDLGYGDVARYNPESKVPTPNLDRLGREGLTFTDAHAPATVCTPSRYSVLTGRMGFRTGISGVFSGAGGPCMIEEDRLTLPGMLRDKGYTTACFGKWHVGLSFPDRNGNPINKNGFEPVKRIDYSRAIPDAPIHRGFDHFFGTACCPGTDFLYAFIDGDRIPVPPTGELDKAPLPKHPYANDNRHGMIAPGFQHSGT